MPDANDTFEAARSETAPFQTAPFQTATFGLG